jgi:hypothetical protein
MSDIDAASAAMAANAQEAPWVRTTPFSPTTTGADFSTPGLALTGLWQSIDGQVVRAYGRGRPGRDAAWQPLKPLMEIAGPAAGVAPPFHYVVETDVLPENVDALNDWYTQEHLPGLAAVPGTIRAARYVRLSGSPKFYACYDLVALDVLESEAWLAVRYTEWSSRVRPMFRNTVRTKFRRMDMSALPAVRP